MAKQVAQDGMVKETTMRRGTTQPMPAVSARADGGNTPKSRPRPTYHPTGVALVDRALDLADELTNGRADWVQRFVTYSFIGGIAALINLLTLAFVTYYVPIPWVSQHIHSGIAFAVATEVSLIANFIPNDRITFSHLPGHSRSWLARCVRFHMTAIGGVTVTFIIFGSLHYLVGLPELAAQAVALIIALAFNFTFHHLFTYRHQEPAVL